MKTSDFDNFQRFVANLLTKKQGYVNIVVQKR